MNFCIALAYSAPGDLPALACEAEAGGFDSALLPDHLVYPIDLRSPYPYSADGKPGWEPSTPWVDPLVAAGALAATTRRLRFVTSVFILSLRHPVLAAKAIGTAAIMSGNRLTLGIGAGWMKEEFDLLGEPFRRRGPRMEEALSVMRALWTGRPVAHQGQFYRFDTVQMSPAPDEPIPIWGGGRSATALRRAATLCDGWIAPIMRSQELPDHIEKLKALRAASSLDDRPFPICAAVSDAFTLDAYRRLEGIGVTHLITVPWLFYGKGETLDRKRDGIRRFADEVIRPMDAERGT